MTQIIKLYKVSNYTLLIFLLVFSIFSNSCGIGNNESNDAILDSLILEKVSYDTLHGEKLDLGDGVFPSRIYSKDDYLVINNQIRSNGLLSIYNLNNLKEKAVRIPQGDGPNELMKISHMNLSHDGQLSIYDRSLGRIYAYDFMNLLEDPAEVPMFTKKTRSVALIEPIQLSAKKYISTNYETNPLSRFIMIDILDSIITKIGTYPTTSQKYRDIGVSEAYYCTFCYSKVKNKLFSAYRNEDLIELYTLEDKDVKLEKSLRGPDFFLSEFNEHIGENGSYQLLPIIDKTKQAYFSVQCSDDIIIVLYNGMLMDSSDKNETYQNHLNHNVFVFNWDGKLIKRFFLDVPIMGRMAVNFERNEIIGISDIEDIGIYSFKYRLK